MSENGMDATVLQRPIVVKTADLYVSSLDQSCGAGDRDENMEIRRLSEQVRKKNRFS